MSAPIASFNFQVNFLGVFFTDTSQNIPTSWNWQFGDGGNSTERNPNYTYAAAGIYQVTLTVTNDDGSDEIILSVEVVTQPAYGYTINEIINEERPSVVVADPVFEDQRKKYWMLHLQILIEPKIADAFVFDETKWPEMVKILIAKLVVYDILNRLAKEAMAQSMSQSNEQNVNQITLAQDGNEYTFVGTETTLKAPTGGTEYQWKRNDVDIVGATTNTYLAQLGGTYICTYLDGSEVEQTEGPIVLTFSNTIVATTSGSGALKSIETGPSKVEWYDSSQTISTIFKPTGGANGDVSAFDQLTSDICVMASRLRIKLPMCPKLDHNTVIPRKVGRKQPPSVQSIFSKHGWIE